MKGATKAAVLKPAVLDNGVTVKVPMFVVTGDTIRVGVFSVSRFVSRCVMLRFFVFALCVFHFALRYGAAVLVFVSH